jgi:hypothetical protein
MKKQQQQLVPEPMTDFGYRKSYVCKSCHNLQPMHGVCVLCWRDDTIVPLTKLTDKIIVDAPDSTEESAGK